MFSSANQPQFTLAIPGLLHDLQILAFRGSEALNSPFTFEIECISERPDLDLERLLNQPAYLAFAQDGGGIHGVIDQVVQGESGHRLTRYHLLLVPRLDYLRHRYNHRIFQHRTVPEIIATILEEHGILADAYRFQLGPTVYPKREYCVQYGESDLHMILRLCEEEGIHYHFQHSPDGHLLVFGDDQTVFPRLGQPTAYVQDNSLVADEPVIKRFSMRLATRTTQVARRDYNFERPHIRMEAGALCEFTPELEDYRYPGRFDDRTRGKFMSRRELERHRADYEQAEGSSDQPVLRSGHLLELSDHPRAQWNGLWLLREVRHEGRQPQVLEESGTHETGAADGLQQGYRNTFVATPADVVYRPAQLHPKPRLLAAQTAVVTGPVGEEIHCDAYGRVKVQFFWDRESQADDKSSCWLRVASGWAGNGYGAITVPRIGMEVLVTFLEGDPDQPRRWRLQRATH